MPAPCFRIKSFCWVGVSLMNSSYFRMAAFWTPAGSVMRT